MDEAQACCTRSQEGQPNADPQPTHGEHSQVIPATPPRKRQIDSEDGPRPKRARLTRKNLAHFNGMAKGGKKESKQSSSSHRHSTNESNSTKTVSTTSSGFAIQAYKNGILDPLRSKPPTNLEDIHKRHVRSRETASPPESAYKQYASKVGRARNEATMVFEVGGKLLKEYDDDNKGYSRSFNQSFTGFPQDVGFNDGLSAPQPDFIEGLEMQEYDPFPVDEHVDGAVLYKDDPSSLTLPHVAGEWKKSGGDMDKARLQSAYDGAALVFARKQALTYMGQADPPGHAAVTSFTTDGTNINFYAHYAAPSDEDPGKTKYHQYQYASANVKDTYQGHKDGRRGLRNAQDYAKDQSYTLRDQLKEHWKQQRTALHSIAEGTAQPAFDPQEPAACDETTQSEYAAQYEDEADYDIVEQPCQPTAASFAPQKRSHHSSKSSQHSHSSSKSSRHAPSSGSHKRKASSSPTSSHESSSHASKHNSYWKKNPNGYYYHKHSDGSITWKDDVDEKKRH